MTDKPLIQVKSQGEFLPSLKESGEVPENVVITFPSILGTENGFGGRGEREYAQTLLDDKRDSAVLFEAFYRDWKPVEGKEYNEGADIIHKSNADPHYIPPEMTQFVRDYLRPLVDKGSNITVFGNSMGGVMIELVRRALVQGYKEEGFSDAEIGQFLQKISGVAVASVLNVEESQGAGFPMVYYAGTGDKVAKGFNPRFDNQTAQHKKPITMRPFPHNPHALLVTTVTNSQINDGHGITSFIVKGEDSSVPSGATVLARNILQNSVDSKTPNNIWELCKSTGTQRKEADQMALDSAIAANRRDLGMDKGQRRI